jgi:hypothetical protein
MIGAIELALAELGSNIITEDEFRDYLRGFLGDTIVTYESIPNELATEFITSGSASITGVGGETSVVDLDYTTMSLALGESI